MKAQNTFKAVILVLFTFFLISCSKNDDNDAVPNSQYQGTWSGSFSGAEDNGTWTADVNASGIATGSATSVTFSNTYQLTGTVSAQGVFLATVGTASTGATFNGQMNPNGNGAGTWINTFEQMNGTWIGTKQ
ncbi:hypothetical protein ACFSX9_02710 [Flavobacterium ardleyense]|uniref:Uncharacterized protein n=1 Tax=Flavobacterium ardleyense TaxID=2038737 RepID=A0ABW5Z6Z4_9FLAO